MISLSSTASSSSIIVPLASSQSLTYYTKIDQHASYTRHFRCHCQSYCASLFTGNQSCLRRAMSGIDNRSGMFTDRLTRLSERLLEWERCPSQLRSKPGWRLFMWSFLWIGYWLRFRHVQYHRYYWHVAIRLAIRPYIRAWMIRMLTLA